MNEPFQLSHLNDDCLRELFSRLPNIDLCAIKDTCRRFKTIADEVAKQRFKYLYECYPTDENLQEHKTILKKFGHFVLTMSLSAGHRKGSTAFKLVFLSTIIFIKTDENVFVFFRFISTDYISYANANRRHNISAFMLYIARRIIST